MSAFVDEYMAELKAKNPGEPEFHQAAWRWSSPSRS